MNRIKMSINKTNEPESSLEILNLALKKSFEIILKILNKAPESQKKKS